VVDAAASGDDPLNYGWCADVPARQVSLRKRQVRVVVDWFSTWYTLNEFMRAGAMGGVLKQSGKS
jgi:hypothetical protein